jgi:hypothetical protein
MGELAEPGKLVLREPSPKAAEKSQAPAESLLVKAQRLKKLTL